MSSRLAAFVLFAACACNSNKPVPGEATSAPAASASPQESGAFELPGVLAVEGGTRAVKFRYAVAAKRPYSEALTILVSTHPRSCKDLEGGYSLSQDETVFRFIVAPSLKGKEWGMVETYYASTSSLGGVPSGTPVAQSDPKKPVRLSIDKELRGWGGATLTVKGDVVAEGCGEVAERIVGPAAPGPARPQKDLSFSVGGQQQTVRAALYDTAHKRLVLSTSPLSCRGAYSYADVALLLDTDGGEANLQGLRVGSITGQTLSPKAKIALGKPENGRVSAKIEKLSFEKEGLVAELSGTADLEVCED